MDFNYNGTKGEMNFELNVQQSVQAVTKLASWGEFCFFCLPQDPRGNVVVKLRDFTDKMCRISDSFVLLFPLPPA